jgi:hypothetical protein
MSTHTKATKTGSNYAMTGRFGGIAQVLVLATVAGITGCATSGTAFDHGAAGVTMAQGTRGMSTPTGVGVQAGEVHVVDGHVNPMVPARLTVEGNAIALRFGRPRAEDAVVHLNGQSLSPVAPETAMPAGRPAMPASGAVRAVLADGSFIVCWKSGDAEQGYRLMAQAWTAGGSPVGSPAAVSPPEMDVLGAPQVTAIGGDRAIATFATSQGNRAELVAVPLQVL